MMKIAFLCRGIDRCSKKWPGINSVLLFHMSKCHKLALPVPHNNTLTPYSSFAPASVNHTHKHGWVDDWIHTRIYIYIHACYAHVGERLHHRQLLDNTIINSGCALTFLIKCTHPVYITWYTSMYNVVILHVHVYIHDCTVSKRAIS